MGRGRHSRSRPRSPWLYVGVLLVLVAGWLTVSVFGHHASRARLTGVTISTTVTPPSTKSTQPISPSPSSTKGSTSTSTSGSTPTTDPVRQATRARAGAVLRENPSIAFAPAAVADLLAGDVDARLMAVLSVAADNVTGLQVYAFTGEKPRRVVELRAADPTKALAFLRAQQPPFRPRIDRTSTGLRLVFQPDLTCQQRLNPQECP